MSAFTISGERLLTSSPVEKLYSFLSDFANFKSILPEDKVEDFSFEDDSCSFTIKGITAIRIRLKEKQENQSLLFESEGLAKFNFKLHVKFDGDLKNSGFCQIIMSGSMNPFIFKMAEKPLQQLVNSMGSKLSQLQINNT